MEISGKVVYVNNEMTPSEKSPDFKTRTFGVDSSVEVNGSVLENYASFQTVNANNRLLDNIEVGDIVKVTCSIKGIKKGKPEVANTSPQNPTNEIIYTSLNAYNVEVIKKKEGGSSQPSQNTTNSQPSQDNAPKKKTPPANIPEGYVWNEVTEKIEEKAPF